MKVGRSTRRMRVMMIPAMIDDNLDVHRKGQMG